MRASMDFEILKRVLAALEARGVHYAIIGAVALNLHGLARSTEDLDIFVEPDAGNIERLKLAPARRHRRSGHRRHHGGRSAR
jgi:predicted nucleotidyltransferase